MNWIFKSQIEKENSIIISGSKTVEPLPSASQKRLHTSVSEVCGWRMSRFLQVDRRELPCERSELSCAKDAIMWAKRAIMRQRRYNSSVSELSCAKGAIIRAPASYHAPRTLSFERQRVIMRQRRYHGSEASYICTASPWWYTKAHTPLVIYSFWRDILVKTDDIQVPKALDK